MQFKWLEDLLCLAQTGSLTRAADSRHVTHPAFGRRIRALESWVGVPLIDRTAFPTRLTPAGALFLEAAREAVDCLHEARAAARKMYGADESLLEVATGKTLSRIFLPGWLVALQEETGPFRVRLHTTSMHEAAAQLIQRNVDLLCCYFHPAVQFYLDEEVFEHATIKQERLIPVCAPEGKKPRYPLSGKGPIPYLAFTPELTQGRILSHFLAESPLSEKLVPAHESDIADALQELAARGAGLAWLPETLVAADLISGRLVRAAGAEAEIAFEIRVYRAADNHKPLLDRLWEAL